MVEFLDRILPGMDLEIGRIPAHPGQAGLKFSCPRRCEASSRTTSGAKVDDRAGERRRSRIVDADVVLVATGRVPYTEGLGLDAVGVALDRKRRMSTDAHFATNVPGIYAIGDVIAGPMLAHKAEDEGMAVAETIAGQHGHVNYDVIPSVDLHRSRRSPRVGGPRRS